MRDDSHISTSNNKEIRLLDETDSVQLREIRLEALQNDPTVFVSFYDFEVDKPDEFYRKMMTPNNMIFGLFMDEKLCAISTLNRYVFKKQRHRALAAFTYVTPSKRGLGLARQIKEFVMEEARKLGITQILSGILATNLKMIELNISLGFEITYTEKNALGTDGVFYDVTNMIKYL